MKRIFIFLPYYGSFPNYFQLYLDSVHHNRNILTVILLTDNDLSAYELPPNLIVEHIPFEEIRKKFIQFYKTETGDLSNNFKYPNILSTPYKFVDFKICYHHIFHDLQNQYDIHPDDYIGYGDCDLIYGLLSNFIDLEKNDFDIIGGWHGHFVAWKNTDLWRYAFRMVPNIYQLLNDNHVHIIDEIAFREPLKKIIQQYKLSMFFANNYFCDIVPPVFYHLYRQNLRPVNFFDVYHANKNIKALQVDYLGHLYTLYDDNTLLETLYVHLQKRPMHLFDKLVYIEGYTILENVFVPNCCALQNGSSNV